MSTATNFGSGKGGGLYVKNLVTGRMERIASFIPDFGVLNFAGNVTWSPDGSRIAFDTSDPGLVPGDSNGVTDVFVVNLATKEVVRASVDEQGRQAGNVSESYTPAWSPDSTKLAFVSDQLIPEDDDLLQGIYIKDLTTGKNQYISTGEYHAKAPAWSRDGSRIAWSENGIKVRDIEAGTTTQIVSSSEADNPVWSPDGTQIAYDEGSRRVYVIDVLSGQRKPVSVDQRGRRTGSQSWGARWSPDGSRIVFNSVGNSGGRVLMKDLVSGELVTVSTNSRGKQADNGSYFGSWSPDGKRIVFTSGAANLVPCDGTGPGPGGHFDVFVKTLA